MQLFRDQPTSAPQRRSSYACLWLALLTLSLSQLALNAANAPACSGARCQVVEVHANIQRPLVSLEFAATVLNVTNEKALMLIDDGSLLWAFDLSARQGCRRPLIRVLCQSVVDYLQRRPAPKNLPSVQMVVDSIFPNHGPSISTAEVSRQWSCDPETVTNLWRAGELTLAKGSKCRPGRGGSALLEFGSVAAFLEARQIL